MKKNWKFINSWGRLPNSLRVRKSFGIILLLAILFSCHQPTSNKTYICPMHPEIQEHKPAKCPICKMNLVEVKTKVDTISTNISDLVQAHYKEVEISIKANGLITYDTRRFENVSSRFAGRIEKLYIKSLYQSVQKGQKLFEVYSPQMLTEQQNLLFLLDNDKSEITLIRAAQQKLLLLGMTQSQIDELIKTRKAMTIFTIYSNFNGYVVGDMPKEGAYIEKGQTLFKLANNEIVWAILKVYEKDIPFIKLNQKAEIYSENSTFSGKTNFIEPFRDKSLNVRVYLQNQSNQLKIGQLINGKIYIDTKKGVWIPKTSVLDLGTKKVVFIPTKNQFQSKTIETGFESNDLIQVVSGLDTLTKIVRNAQYLTDSETFIK